MDKKEYFKQYYQEHKERLVEQKKQWYQKNKERIAEYNKEYQKQYREANNERLTEYQREYHKQYYQNNKERLADYQKEHRNTPFGRAAMLVRAYNCWDKRAGRGKGNLTPQWVHDNILYKPCAHCGAVGWQIIGCNRIDNSKPHTIGNVEPCCYLCNCKLNGNELARQVYQYTLEDELVGVYESVREAARQTGYYSSGICNCCNGKLKHYKGFMWSYVPLDLKKEG